MKIHFRRWIAATVLLTTAFLCSCSSKEPTRPTEGSSTATLCAVGDIFLTDQMQTDAQTTSGMPDYQPLFSAVIPEISRADLALGNFEGTFANSGKGSYPDAFAAALSRCGFDILQTANSYSVYYGLSGLERTKSVIREQGMEALGTFVSQEEREEQKVLIKEINGIRFAFLAFTKGFNGMGLPADSHYCVNLLYSDYATDYEEVDRSGILSLVNAAVAAEPDFIIAALHWGSENVSGISPTQEEITELLLNNGVDVILGSHSHRVEKVERRTVTNEEGVERECVIAYGLGDFCATKPGECNTSIVLNLEFTRDHADGSHRISEVSYVPVSTVDNGEGAANRYTVVPSKEAVRLYENNYYLRVGEAAYTAMVGDLEDLDETVFPPPETESTEETE